MTNSNLLVVTHSGDTHFIFNHNNTLTSHNTKSAARALRTLGVPSPFISTIIFEALRKGQAWVAL